MKLIQVIFVVAFLIVLKTAESKMTMDQIKNTLKPFKNSCLKKTSIDPDLVEGTKKGQFPSDPTLMCFYRCVFQMMKIMKNGEILIDSIISQIDLMMPDEYVDKMKEMSRGCYDIATKKEEACEIAFDFVKCFYEADSELFFFP